MTVTPRLVVLFDIDGTLLHTMGAGLRGMSRAFGRLHGRPDALDGVPVSGRTDRAIVTDGFHRIGLTPDDGRIRELRDVYVNELPDELERVVGQAPGVLPGVTEAIAAFEAERGVAIGLLTGNFEVIAALKLNHYRLSRPFTFGAFGDDHLDRRDLLPMALARAERADIHARDARVVVIGDTPLDVDCAHAHGAMAVAVATGHYSCDELKGAGADLVVDALDADVAAEIAASVLSPSREIRR